MTVEPNSVLIHLRQAKGESQAEAARSIDISQSMLAMLEAGYRRGGDEAKIKIANHYGKTVDEIFLQIILTLSDRKEGST